MQTSVLTDFSTYRLQHLQTSVLTAFSTYRLQYLQASVFTDSHTYRLPYLQDPGDGLHFEGVENIWLIISWKMGACFNF